MPKSIFAYPPEFYDPVNGYTDFVGTIAQAKKEIGRLRDIAHKRVQRLEKAGFEKMQTYKRLEMISKIRLGEIKSESQASLALSQFYQFLTKSESTVTGARRYKKQKEENVKNVLSTHGYKVNDLPKFGEFMEKFRAYYGRRIIPSDQAAQLHSTLEGEQFDVDEIMMHFEEYTADLSETARIVEEYKQSDKKDVMLSDYVLSVLRGEEKEETENQYQKTFKQLRGK